MPKQTETWLITLRTTRVGPTALYTTAIITRPGRAAPLYQAVRDTAERALLAALGGARLSWVPGTHTVGYKTRAGSWRTANVDFRAESVQAADKEVAS